MLYDLLKSAITPNTNSIPENSKWDKLKEVFSDVWNKLFPEDKRIKVKPVIITEDSEITKNRALDLIAYAAYIILAIFSWKAIIEIVRILTNYPFPSNFPW